MTEDKQIEEHSPLNHFGDKLKQWQPGQSGNPGGRPKGKSITAELRKLIDKGTNAEDMAKVLYNIAKSGGRAQVNALKELLDRTDGKVPETHKVEADIPISIVFKKVDNATEQGQK